MGYIAHHAMVITGWDDDTTERAHSFCTELGLKPGPITEVQVNLYRSFFVPPDGSKEGWETSDERDEARREFRRYLRATRGLDWAEVRFGGDNPEWAQLEHFSSKEDDED